MGWGPARVGGGEACRGRRTVRLICAGWLPYDRMFVGTSRVSRVERRCTWSSGSAAHSCAAGRSSHCLSSPALAGAWGPLDLCGRSSRSAGSRSSIASMVTSPSTLPRAWPRLPAIRRRAPLRHTATPVYAPAGAPSTSCRPKTASGSGFSRPATRPAEQPRALYSGHPGQAEHPDLPGAAGAAPLGSVRRTVVRHEALLVRMEVGVLRRLAVVAVG
jgi:hypothetical protein